MPVDPTLVDQFEPEDVPTVGDLLSQLQGQSADTEGGIKDEGQLCRRRFGNLAELTSVQIGQALPLRHI